MPRGGHKVKPAKPAQVDACGAPPKLSRRNTSWVTSISKSSFLSRTSTEMDLTGPPTDQPLPMRRVSTQQYGAAELPEKKPQVPMDFVVPSESTISMNATVSVEITVPMDTSISDRPTSTSIAKETTATPMPNDPTQTDVGLDSNGTPEITSSGLSNEGESTLQPTIDLSLLPEPTGEDSKDEGVFDTFEDLTGEEIQSTTSSIYSRDRLSIYSSDSASIYSSASSIYSSGASIYSFNEESEITSDPRLPVGIQYQQRTRSVTTKRLEPQDAAARERSTLAKKAALFKNSRLSPQLPSFSTSLPTWSLVCRAALASQDCYDSEALTRRGTYTAADTSKDIKAMIVDEQMIDNSRFIIVSIRGTQFQCLADWAVNKAANPVKPIGFLDDEENACHAGFLQVTKAMIGQVASQLHDHPSLDEKPSLLFTGHSAGGAVAAMLYSHMLSTTVSSDLTNLASRFPSINCVTFGAPPLSLSPLPARDHTSGVFLSFANEGDPVLRLSNAAYVKSLAKLMTASPPSSVATAPPVKVVRHSRGTRVIRQAVPTAPLTPWDELPLWPTPAVPLTNAGEVVLLRDTEKGTASASQVAHEDLREVIFSDLAQHAMDMYLRRVKEVALSAMMGRM